MGTSRDANDNPHECLAHNGTATMSLSTEHLSQLTGAKALLENDGLPAKIGGLFGISVGNAAELLPADWPAHCTAIAHDTVMLALRGMLMTLGIGDDIFPPLPRFAAAMRAHDRVAGLPGLALELPVSVMLLCRSIADIAHANGEQADNLRTRLACLESLALGEAGADHGAGYFATRDALTAPTERAADYLSNTFMVDDASPELDGYVAVVALRFRRQIETQAAAEAALDIGAHYTSAVKLLLIDHFSDIARGHFVVRRLERLYGMQEVRAPYERIRVLRD